MTVKAFTLSAATTFILGALSLFTSEARCTRNWVHSLSDHPGLWRGWLGSFIGWIAILATLAFVLARMLSHCNKCMRWVQIIRWVTVILVVLSVVVFTIFNVMWGIRTNWSFFK